MVPTRPTAWTLFLMPSAGVRPAPSDHSRLPPDANAEELERLVLSLMPDNEFAAIRAYREQMGVPLGHAAEAVEAIARRHGITPRPIPVAAHIGILLCIFGIAASFIPAVIRHVITHTWAYDELLPDLPAGNEQWVSVPIVGLLSWEWTSITATFLTLGLFLIGTDADAQPMTFLHRQLRSLWESALSLFGIWVIGASSHSMDSNPSDAPLSGAALEAQESVSHGAEPPATTAEPHSVGGSPFMPGKPTGNPPPALPH
jgi:hypothetical protein